MPGLDTNAREQVDLDLVIGAVREAGDLALGHFRKGVKAWTKPDGTPVSDADLEVDRALGNVLQQARPGYGWQSEETPALHGEKRFWLVDPIDGTSAFVGGIPLWCIAVAVIDNGRPVLAVIHAPAQQKLYSAVLGGGARLNGSALNVSGRVELEGASILASPSVFKPQRWRTPLPRMERVSVPSLALRLALIAEGASDAAIAMAYKHDWDLAAGDILLREAGGVMSDLDGAALRYGANSRKRRGFVAATPLIHKAILAHGPKAIG